MRVGGSQFAGNVSLCARPSTASSDLASQVAQYFNTAYLRRAKIYLILDRTYLPTHLQQVHGALRQAKSDPGVTPCRCRHHKQRAAQAIANGESRLRNAVDAVDWVILIYIPVVRRSSPIQFFLLWWMFPVPQADFPPPETPRLFNIYVHHPSA